jgi:tetratricopeptide (TPR) repeat protein
VAIRLNNLGGAWHSLEQYEKAIGYYELALKSDLKTYGEDHPTVATYHNNLGGAWYSLGKYKKAIGYFELALNVINCYIRMILAIGL